MQEGQTATMRFPTEIQDNTFFLERTFDDPTSFAGVKGDTASRSCTSTDTLYGNVW